MLKVLFIVTQSEMGGAQRYIYEISRSLSPEKYKILVAAGQGDGELFRKCQMSYVRCQKLKQMKRAPWLWQIILAIGEIYRLLKKERPDVLFLCSTTAGLLGSIASFIYGGQTSVIYRIGGWAFRDPRAFWKNWLILLAEKLTSPLKDKIIVNSEIDKELALKYKIAPESKIVKIYNGIDINSLDFFPREVARRTVLRATNGKVVGTVANFYKTKGLKYLIEAIHILDTKYKIQNTKYIIIGDGRERPKLENLIKKYKLQEKVIFVGRIPDAYKYLKAFDVFVLPSLKEGFPWIILEAVAAEIPIIATKVGAIPEVLEEEFLVEPKNSQALAEKIKWLLERPQEAKVLGIQAKAKLIKEFSLQRMVEATEQVIR